MRRLIGVFVGRTYHIVLNLMSRPNYVVCAQKNSSLNIHIICVEYQQLMFWLSNNKFSLVTHWYWIMQTTISQIGINGWDGSCVAVKAECDAIIYLALTFIRCWNDILVKHIFITIGRVKAFSVAINGKAHLDHVLHKLYHLFEKHVSLCRSSVIII